MATVGGWKKLTVRKMNGVHGQGTFGAGFGSCNASLFLITSSQSDCFSCNSIIFLESTNLIRFEACSMNEILAHGTEIEEAILLSFKANPKLVLNF